MPSKNNINENGNYNDDDDDDYYGNEGADQTGEQQQEEEEEEEEEADPFDALTHEQHKSYEDKAASCVARGEL